MIDKNHVWMVLEYPSELQYVARVIGNIAKMVNNEQVYKMLVIPFRSLQPFLTQPFEILQIGYLKDSEYPTLSGILKINKRIFIEPFFKAETSIDMKQFKPFFKRLTKKIEMKNDTKIIILFYKEIPVWVKIEGRVGAIAPLIKLPKEIEMQNIESN